MKTFLFRLWQWLWGFPQSLLGLVIYLIHRDSPHETYHGCVVTRWNVRAGLGVGMFLFLGPTADPRVLVHEFGHSVQSAILGPLFLPIMGIPSFIWCNLPWAKKLRREKGVSYYRFYPESSANFLGSLVTGEACDLL